MVNTQNGVLQKDDNGYPVMGGTSSVDDNTIVNSAVDPSTRRLLVDFAGGGTGTVTSVSVVSANGFAGTVATATTTPAITLTTTVTGILKGNGTAISAATANTDYQVPITLTTTGSSGAATFDGTTLNIPQYSGGGGGTPGGLNTQIQYNNAGSFGGVTGATTDGTSLSLTTPHFLNPTINGAGAGLATLAYPNTASNATITVPATTGTLALTSQLTSGTVTSVASADSSITVTNPTTTVDLAVVKAPVWTTARLLAGNSVNGSANVAFANKFIVQGTTDTGLSGAQFLGALTTGIVKNTTTTGVLSIATAGTDYEVPLTFSTGLTRTVNTITVNTSQNIATLSNLTSNGLVTTSGSAGTLGVTVPGAGILTFLATPSSANLASAVTDETGSGSLVFATSPTLTTAVLGSSTATTQTPSDNSTKVATTAYVDAAVLGQNFKEAALVATTANLVGVYVSGVFTYTATGTDTIDGVTLALGNRVLVKNQSTTFQNGWYVVTTAGAIGVAGVLTRSSDANSSGQFKTGDSSFVTSGTANSTTTWAYTGVDSPTLGTDAITFAQTAGQGSFTSGNGIAITGNSIAIDTSVTVDKTTAQTLTNKTLTSPILTTPAIGAATGTSLVITAALTSGGNGATGGSVKLFGATSGDATIRVAAAAGTSTIFQLPATNGSNTNVLQTDGSGNTSWVPISGSGTVNSGTSGQITYYSASSATVSGASMFSIVNPNGGTGGVKLTLGTGAVTAGDDDGIIILKVSGGSSNIGTTQILGASGASTGTFTLSLPAATSDTLVAAAFTQTLTNKRITRRLTTTNAPGATPSTNTNNVDIMNFTGVAAAITSMSTNLTGTPVDGDKVEFRFLDNGTARAITWGALFEATTVALPTTTVISTLLRVGFEWYAANSKWDCIAVA